jgi:small GTP-binding protein
VKIWNHVRGAWPKWRSRHDTQSSTAAEAAAPDEGGARHLELMRQSLRELIEDAHVPPSVRDVLAKDYAEVQAALDKIEHEHVYIAAFGRVSVGKSALLNALLGEERFVTSPLHGATRESERAPWHTEQTGGVYLLDTPGINEVAGERRERLAHDVAGRSDLVLFVVEGDITDTELRALRLLAQQHRPLVLVFNKVDRYTSAERDLLLATLAERTRGLIEADNIVPVAAQPGERIYVQVDAAGRETEVRRRPPPDITVLRERLWLILEREGKTLAALNAGMFASRLSDQVAQRIAAIKRRLAERLVRNYCLGKGVAIAFNPIPVADLVAATAVDLGMIVHLSRLYGLPITRSEAGSLMRTIGGQMLLLMGTVWGMHLLSSALKGASLGVSTLLTAGAQGAIAYYNTYIIGRAAERYFVQGKSWGEGGPKRVIQEILDSLDRDSILAQARSDILAYLGREGR